MIRVVVRFQDFPLVVLIAVINSQRLLCFLKPVAPVAYQVIFEPGIGQFREFEPRRVHSRRYKFVGTFS